MPSTALLRPDVLVLAGGGTVGEAWMNGVLAGLEDVAGVDYTHTEAFVGTSAGSIVAARLAAGRRPPRPDGAVVDGGDAGAGGGGGGGGGAAGGEDATRDGFPHASLRAARDGAASAARVGVTFAAPLATALAGAAKPASALARAAVLSKAAPHGRPLHLLHGRVARWDARFDGRLRVCAVDRRTGKRVVFGAPGAPVATVADAVCASCAIPWVFAPVQISGREYVDGGAWSVTNLDAARTGRGTQVLCLDPTAGLGGRDRRMAAVRSAFRLASGLEIAALRRLGADVEHIAPDPTAAGAMGNNFMAPERAAPALAAGYAQGRRLAAL